MNRLQKQYQEQVVPQLQKEFGVDNAMAVPKIKKIVVNTGISEPQHQDKALENVSEQLAAITGQKPKVTSARQSIAGFKIRTGDPLGLMVTLRGKRMYQFLDKLISIVLPRVKDFQGVSLTAFDQSGNYSLGIREQIVFPEIDYDKIDKVRGLQISIVINGDSTQQNLHMLKLLGMPFAKEDDNN